MGLDHNHAPAAPLSDPTLREPVCLIKGRHQWRFWCDSGDEASLLRRLQELASDPNAPLDAFDAAIVCHQLSRRLKAGLLRTALGSPDPAAISTAMGDVGLGVTAAEVPTPDEVPPPASRPAQPD